MSLLLKGRHFRRAGSLYLGEGVFMALSLELWAYSGVLLSLYVEACSPFRPSLFACCNQTLLQHTGNMLNHPD